MTLSVASQINEEVEHILKLALESLDDDQASDIVTIDLARKSSIADYMIIASGRSSRHVGAITDHLLEKLKRAGRKNIRIEGQDTGDWILLDAFDIVIHIFRPEVREFYNLEKMWQLDVETAPAS